MRKYLAVLALILFMPLSSYAQFSRIISITAQNNNGTQAAFYSSPFTIKAGANCTWAISGTTATFNCAAGAATSPGGSPTQLQYNNTTFGGVVGSSVGPAGEIAISTTAAAALNALSVTEADDDTDVFILKNASAPAGSQFRFQKVNSGGVVITNNVNPMGADAQSSLSFATDGSWTMQALNGGVGQDFINCPGDSSGCLTATNFGAPTFNKVTITAPASGSTLTILNGKVLTVNKSLTFDGTDSTTMTFPSVSATITRTVASGAKALATGAISSGACTTAQTDTATGTLTTDTVAADFNADPTSTTGYAPVTTGMLTIIKYPTADTINFKVCNLTLASITPGAVTLNWRVTR